MPRISRWVLVAFGGGFLTALLLASGRARQAPVDVIEAREFKLVGADGSTRARIRIGEAGPSIELLDKKGNQRVVLEAGNDGVSRIVVQGNADSGRVAVEAGGDQTKVEILDKKGTVRARMYSEGDDAKLSLHDSAGVVRAGAKSTPGGGGFMCYASDEQLMGEFIEALGTSHIGLRNPGSKAVLDLHVVDSKPELVMRDSLGRPRLELGGTGDGGRVVLLGQNGRERIRMSEVGELASVALYDRSEKTRATLAIKGDTPGMVMFDSKDQFLFSLFGEPEQPTLTMYGPGGSDRVRVSSGDSPGFEIMDNKGRARGSWTVENEEARFTLSDQEGRSRTGMYCKDEPFVQMWGEHGERSVLIAQSEKSGAWIVMFDQDGHARIEENAHRGGAAVAILDQDKNLRFSARHAEKAEAQLQLLTKDRKVLWSANPDEPAPVDDRKKKPDKSATLDLGGLERK